MSTSALASLTATYTDSEGEEDEKSQENDALTSLKDSQSPQDTNSASTTSSRVGSPPNNPVTVTTRLAKLVSYHDDTVVSDEGEGDDEIPQRLIFIHDSDDKEQEALHNVDDLDNLIPPEPQGICSAELQEKITRLYEKMQTQQVDMNAVIQKRKDFRNPSIYEKLIQFCGLNELGTNYPPSIYDPLKYSKESFYEELAKVQRTEMDKREKERKNKIEAAVSLKKLEEDNKNKRKSKWDMPGGGAVKVNQPGLVAPPTLTSSATGTKTTVISAFGSLPKKPKL
ncbi:SAP30-binding protein [Euwallacea fornicatus]|uniref:SAP30-binding protein n=1 Tax=Euwallacea fornicatus TaxID=995702 RepID=UPI00338F6CE5